MSLFSWLFPHKKNSKTAAAESSGLSRMDATRPVSPKRGAKDAALTGNAQPANRKGERMARRELLYTVVREAMLHSGVLTSSYKFKVLSLDPRGRQFMVMVDLAREYGGETSRLAEIEALIAQHAKARYDVIVTAVYWRMNEHVALGVPGARTPRTQATPSQPAPLDSGPVDLGSTAAAESGPAPLVGTPPAHVPASAPTPLPVAAAVAAAEVPRPKSRFEPIQADEVAAFKHALAAGLAKPAAVAQAAVAPKVVAEAVLAAGAGAAGAVAAGATAKAFDGSGKHGPQSYTLLTGFEDTEMPDSETRMPALSGTQYGDLT